jgi:acetate kinase
MRVLVVNTGSSSLKVRFLDAEDRIVADASFGPDAISSDDVAEFVQGLDAVDAVGHRVVHAGRIAEAAVRADDRAMQAITAAAPLAPLHQRAAISGLTAMRSLLPGIPAVACFDTAFHASLPDGAATYALPAEWRRRWPLRRYGFHGLSHAYAVHRAAELVDRPADARLRMVSCHLGAGASLCAARGGRSLDTTMGFTPLEGLVMATRAGSVDPGLVLWLINHAGISADEVAHTLEEASGLTGLAGTGDMREVLARRDVDERAVLAFDVYLHRLAREIAAMTATLGGLDVLVFTGGVGENAPAVRLAAAERLAFLGIAIDADRDAADDQDDREVSATVASVRTLVVHAREDLEIARLTREVLGSDAS